MADSADLARLAADMGASAILGRPVGAALVPGVVEVDGVAYRNIWVPPGKRYIQAVCEKPGHDRFSAKTGACLSCQSATADAARARRKNPAPPPSLEEKIEHGVRWRPVPSFFGYEVSDAGSVRSYRFERSTVAFTVAPRLLTARPDPGGYLKVSLGRQGTFAIHRLVLAAFVGPLPEGMEVAHNDGDRTNNALGNLRYATHRENVGDQVRHGTRFRKVTPEIAAYIRASYRPGSGTNDRGNGAELGARFGITRHHVVQLAVGRRGKPRCVVCFDTGILPKDSDLSPDEPCDCVYGGAA